MNIEEALIILRFDGAAATNGIRQTKTALNDLTRGAADYGRQLGGSLSDVSKAVTEISKLGSGLAGVFAIPALVGIVNNTEQATRNIANMADNIGLAADKLTAVERITERLGGDKSMADSFLKSIAQKKAALESGFASPTDIMPPQFFAGGGDYNKALMGTPAEAMAEYAKVFANIKKLHGGTAEEQEAYASQQMLSMGIAEGMLPVFKKQADELQRMVELESKKLTLTKEDAEVSRRYTEAYTLAIQAIENSSTKLFRASAASTVDYIEDASKAIVDEMQDPRKALIDLANAIAPLLGGLDTAWNFLKKMSEIDIASPIKAAKEAAGDMYDKTVPVGMQQRDQNIAGNVAAFFGDKDAIAATATLDGADKYGSLLSKQEKMKVAMDYFVSQGRTVNQAAGMTANINAESIGFRDDVIRGKTRGDSGSAYGLGQWRHARQTHFQDMYGKPLEGAGLMDQLRYYNEEFGAYETVADAKLKQSKTAYEAGANVSTYFERPRDTQEQARSRGSHAEKIAREYMAANKAVNTKDLVQPTTPAQGANVTINVQQDIKATDPMETGRECKSAIENLNKSAPYQSGMCN